MIAVFDDPNSKKGRKYFYSHTKRWGWFMYRPSLRLFCSLSKPIHYNTFTVRLPPPPALHLHLLTHIQSHICYFELFTDDQRLP
jgi:hypothetical protein